MLHNDLQIDTQRTGHHRLAHRRRALGLTAICLIGALVALFLGAGFLAHQVQEARDSMEQRRQIAMRARLLQSARSLLQDAEAGQRGLLLTENSSYQVRYEDAARELPRILDAAVAASRDDEQIAPHADEIRRLAGLTLTDLAESIRLYHAGRKDLALRQVRADKGQDNVRELRSHVDMALNALAAQGAAVDADGLAETNIAKRLAWWTAFSLAAVMVFAALQIRSLVRMRSNYEKQAATQASILNTIVDEIPASLAILDQDMRYRLVNKVFERWRRISRKAVIGKTLAEVMGDEEFERSRPWLERSLKGEAVSYEKSYPDRPISLITASYNPMFLEDGTVVGVVTLAHDTTAHRNERERLQRLSERDSLTGLLNRAAFETWLADASEEQGAHEIALLYIDLDHFKPVNDQYGHSAGDAVLREIAERLRALVRPSDVVARIGGDEFAVGLTGIKNLTDAQHIAGKVVTEAKRPIHVDGKLLRVGASVGVAADASAEHGGGKALIARADEMLYRAKRSGRDRFQMHLVKA
jgi:diguanylate cyclase (GGDEF)-like protein/PAS domain S-box-containing protein